MTGRIVTTLREIAGRGESSGQVGCGIIGVPTRSRPPGSSVALTTSPRGLASRIGADLMESIAPHLPDVSGEVRA